jgi:phosphate transport system substrate-binding protein
MKRALVAAVMCVGTFVGAARGSVSLKGEGATFPKPLYDIWIAKFHGDNPDIVIDYQGSGSGGGIKAITNRTVDFAGSDVKLTKKEMADAGDLVYVPTCVGAVVAAYNLPGLNGDLKLSGPVLADIFLGKVTNWNDGEIVALNPGAVLPDEQITPVYRSDGSGTNAVFSGYLTGQSDEFAAKVGAGKSVEWPVGQGAQANNGVTATVKGISGALGYVELNYALENNVSMALVQNKAGNFIKPTLAAVTESAAAVSRIPAVILNANGQGAYPISSFTYILVHKDLSYLGDRGKVSALVKFLTWAETDGQKLAADRAYAPLPDAVVSKALENIHALIFNGTAAQ